MRCTRVISSALFSSLCIVSRLDVRTPHNPSPPPADFVVCRSCSRRAVNWVSCVSCALFVVSFCAVSCFFVVVKNRGNTALHYAYAFGFQQLGKYLASNGADDTLLNDQG